MALESLSLVLGHFVFCNQLHWNLDVFRRAKYNYWSNLLVLLFHKFEVKEVVPERDGELKCDFSKSLAETDTRTTQKWRKGIGITFAAIWFLVVGARWVKAFRDEFLRLLPLSRIILDHFDGYDDGLTF